MGLPLEYLIWYGRASVSNHTCRALYESNIYNVKIISPETNDFKVEAGIRQGCILSPKLFNIYIYTEHVMRTALGGWYRVGLVRGWKLIICGILMLSSYLLRCYHLTSDEERVKLINRVEIASSDKGLLVNCSKTKLDDYRSCKQQSSRYNTGCRLWYCQKLYILGSLSSNKSDCMKEINRCIRIAKTAMTCLTRVWKTRVPLKQQRKI